MEQKIFTERQGHDMETYIPARQIGGQFRGKQAGIGSGHINIHIPIHHEGIDGFLPLFHFLDLIEQDIDLALHSFHHIFHMQIEGFRIGNIHPFKTLEIHIDDVVLPYPLTLQLFGYQL